MKKKPHFPIESVAFFCFNFLVAKKRLVRIPIRTSPKSPQLKPKFILLFFCGERVDLYVFPFVQVLNHPN